MSAHCSMLPFFLFAVIMYDWEMTPGRGAAWARGLDLFVFQFFTCPQIVSFSSQAEGIYWPASFRDPVEYNIKLQGGEKTCSALK